MRFQIIHSLIALIVSCTVARTATAQLSLPSTTSEIGMWIFAPAVTTGSVEGFLLWAKDGSVTGDNPSILWYQRNTDGSWQAWGWRNGNLCDAVAFARSSLEYEELFVENLQIHQQLAECEGTEARPTPMIYGVFIDDPIAFLLDGSMESALLVENIARNGGSAAPLISGMSAFRSGGSVSMPSGCPDDDFLVPMSVDLLLNTVARASELAIFETTAIPEEAVALGLCWCTAKDTPTPLSPTYSSVQAGSANHCIKTERIQWVRTYTGSTFICCNACPPPSSSVEKTCYEFLALPNTSCAASAANSNMIWIPCP